MTKRILLSLSMLLAVMTALNAQKIAVTKGQKLETVSTTTMTMDVMGQSINNETSVTSQIEVKDVTAKGYVFANTISHMVVKGSMMGQDMNFDSDKKEDMDGQLGQVLKDRIGTAQEIQVDKNGKVTDTRDTSKKASAGMSDMLNMGADFSKGQAYPVLIQLPAKAVKPGDSWTDSTGTPATVKMITTYTLKEITADGVVINFTGILEKSGTIEQNNMEIQMDMKGTVKGDALYETASGLLKKNTIVSDITGTLGVMGQSAPLTMKSTVDTRAKKL